MIFAELRLAFAKSESCALVGRSLAGSVAWMLMMTVVTLLAFAAEGYLELDFVSERTKELEIPIPRQPRSISKRLGIVDVAGEKAPGPLPKKRWHDLSLCEFLWKVSVDGS